MQGIVVSSAVVKFVQGFVIFWSKYIGIFRQQCCTAHHLLEWNAPTAKLGIPTTRAPYDGPRSIVIAAIKGYQ